MSAGSGLTLIKTARFSVLGRSSSVDIDAGKQVEKRQIISHPSPSAMSTSTTPPFPPTERIYMLDTYQMAAEAKILGVVEDPQGPAVILDRTVFHPQGGGQPSDQGTITCESCTVSVSMVRDVGGVIHHFGAISGASAVPSSPCSPPRPDVSAEGRNYPGLLQSRSGGRGLESCRHMSNRVKDGFWCNVNKAGEPASLALDSAKRLRHAALHSAGHAVDRAVVGAVGAGVLSPLKGYHFDDSPHVEYRGVLPQGLEKDAFVEKLNAEIDKLVAADVETLVEVIDEGVTRPYFLCFSHVSVTRGSRGPSSDGGVETAVHAYTGRAEGGGGPAPAAARARGAAGAGNKYGAATRIVTVAGLSCPCGGTHVRSTRDLWGTRVTKVKAKKGTLRISYTVSTSA
ncbi:unnamed protein product [Scytosiphon promiscuus]